MEDDRVIENQDKPVGGVPKIVGAVFAASILLCLWLGFAPDAVNPSIPKGNSVAAPVTGEDNSYPLKDTNYLRRDATPTPAPVPTPKEMKKEYIASTKKIGGKSAPIYYKEFFKNPERFQGERINLPGKIMVIEESQGKTVIQIQVTGNFDSVIVRYDGTAPVYEGDRIMVYGEGAGTFEGSNRMGASMLWPVIEAKYIVKRASAED